MALAAVYERIGAERFTGLAYKFFSFRTQLREAHTPEDLRPLIETHWPKVMKELLQY